MKLFIILKAEMRKYIQEIKNYYPDYIGNFITTYIFFMGFFFLLQDKQSANSSVEVSKSLVGFLIWFFSINVIFEASATISEEKQIGTLEQILLKPAGIIWILVARSICWTLISIVQITCLVCLILMTTGINITLEFEIIPVLIVTLIGLYGFGFILAGLTILFTKTASFSSIIQYFLLFFTGTIIDIDTLPNFLQIISRSLPLTLGIELSQKIITENLSLLEILRDKSMYFLLSNSVVYFLFGFIFFLTIFRIAKIKGVVKQY